MVRISEFALIKQTRSTVSDRKSTEMRALVRPGHGWENTGFDFKEVGCEGFEGMIANLQIQ
jgi:hypothetical protein